MSNDIFGHLIFKSIDSQGTGYTFKMICTGIRFEGEITKKFYKGELAGYGVKYRFGDDDNVYLLNAYDTDFEGLKQDLIKVWKVRTAGKQDLMGFSWPRGL